DPHHVPDGVDGVDHRVAHEGFVYRLDEGPVDLEVVDREVLEVAEGGEARAEIVEGEGKALVLEAPDEARGRGVVLDRGRLGYLEAEAGRLEGVAANLVEDYVDQGFVQEGRAGKIDGDDALRELGAPFGKGFVRGQRILDDPVIDKGHEIVALRGRYEIARARYRSVLVHEAEEDLRLGLEVDRVGKGDYRLLVEHEAALLGGLVDLRDPFHVAAA